jgi:nucleoside-diphosphate-sugar epimerase
MVEQTFNDNEIARADGPRRDPDAHGQAAMLLVESLIHGLIARSFISTEDAIEIISVAAEVKEEVAYDLGDSPATMRKSLTILESIRGSLSNDLPGR